MACDEYALYAYQKAERELRTSSPAGHLMMWKIRLTLVLFFRLKIPDTFTTYRYAIFVFHIPLSQTKALRDAIAPEVVALPFCILILCPVFCLPHYVWRWACLIMWMGVWPGCCGCFVTQLHLAAISNSGQHLSAIQ